MFKIAIFAVSKTLRYNSMKNDNADENMRRRDVKRRKPWYGYNGENIALIVVVVVLASVFLLDRCDNNAHQQQPASIIMRDTGGNIHKQDVSAPSVEPKKLPDADETPEETARREGLEDGYNDGMEDGEVGEKYETHYSESASEYSGRLQEYYEEGYEEGYDEGYGEGRQMHDDAL